MSSAFRQKNGQVVISCDACGSTGVPGARAATTRVSTSENDAALSDHKTVIDARHRRYEIEMGVLLAAARAEKRDPTKEANFLLAGLHADLAKMVDEKPADSSHHVVETCPWCKANLGVKIEPMPAPLAADPKADAKKRKAKAPA